MRETTINELLGDFTPVPQSQSRMDRGAVTIKLPADAKARYDLLQQKSGRQFGKKAREVLLKLIELAEARIAG